MSYRLLDRFRDLFLGKEFRHRSSPQGDTVAIQFFEDLYDPYADKAYVMLMDEKASDTTIAAYLFKIASEHMGLSDHKRIAERSNHVAKLLVGLRRQL